jgi:hypothetical protein
VDAKIEGVREKNEKKNKRLSVSYKGTFIEFKCRRRSGLWSWDAPARVTHLLAHAMHDQVSLFFLRIFNIY